MSDVTRVSGAGTPPDPFSAKNQKVDGEKFRAHIDRTDTEQRKKKKKPQKDAEDLEAEADEIRASRASAKEPTPAELKIPKGPMIKEVDQSDEQQKKQQKRSGETSEAVQALEATKAGSKQDKVVSELKLEEKKGENTASLQEEIALEGATVPPPPPETEAEIEIKEETKTAAIQQPIQKKKKEHEAATVLSTGLPDTSPAPSFLSASGASMPGYASMKAETFQLFERMVMSITVMMDQGIRETVIHLNSREFTLFGGGQLIIREYSTAPKAFNIEFLGDAHNTALFAKSVDELMKAHQNGRYNYRINRIDTSLLRPEKPVFHRKENLK